MAIKDYLLKYDIQADVSELKSALNDVDGFGVGLSRLANPAAIATAGIAALGAAAVTAGATLFNLAKTASDFGSEIFDASEKTGLTAEALSAMKFAADQSGSSMEAIIKGIAKFSKTVGDASDGLQTATRDLSAFGITPQQAIADLDGTLGKVFQTILNAKGGTEQLILAQKAFGRSGADLLPFIKSFDGDLNGLIRTAKDLGVTISDEAARQADAFGDQLDTVSAQLAGVGRTIGFAVMPQLTEMASNFSIFLAQNKGQVQLWANATAIAFTDVANAIGYMLQKLNEWQDWIMTHGGALGAWALSIRQRAEVLTIQGDANNDPGYQTRLPGLDYKTGLPINRPTGVPSNIPRVTSVRAPRSAGRSANDAQRAAEAASREAERAERDRVSRLQADYDHNLRYFEANQQKLVSVAARAVAERQKTDEEFARFQEELELSTAQNRIDSLKSWMAELDNSTADYAREYAKAQSDITIAEINLDTLRNNIAANRAERAAQQKERDEAELKRIEEKRQAQNRSWKEYIEGVAAADAAEDARAAKAGRLNVESQMATAPGTLLGGAAGSLGIDLVSIFGPNDAMLSGAEHIKAIYADIATFAGESIGSMVQGLAQMGAAWLSTGEFSAKAALQMVSAAAISIATQAGFKAVFEYAEGLASQAATFGVPNPASVMHFAAASTYATVAAIAGGVGIGTGLAARAFGGGGASSGGGGSSSYGGGGSQSFSPDPYSRQTQYAYQSGQNQPYRELAQAINRLDQKIGSMKPGDVLTRGIQQRPGAVGRAVVGDIKRTGGKQMAKHLGMT